MNIEQALKILGVSINDNFEDIDIRWRELVTSESLKQQDSLITVEQLNDKLILLNTARDLLKSEAGNIFQQRDIEEISPQSTPSVNVLNEATSEFNIIDESIEKGLSAKSPFGDQSIEAISNELNTSIFISHGYLNIHLAGQISTHDLTKLFDHLQKSAADNYSQILLDITGLTSIDSTSISLLINFLKLLKCNAQSLAIVTSSDSFEMVLAFMDTECQNILSNYLQAIEILMSKTSQEEHGWHGLPHSKAMFSTNHLILGPNVKVKGDLSLADIPLLQSFSKKNWQAITHNV